MPASHAFVLGAVQGLGEFLPISSSGHLVVTPWLLGWPEHGLAFDVALHLGTLGAVLYAFWRDWWAMLAGAWRGLLRGNPAGEPGGRMLLMLAAASVPGPEAASVREASAASVPEASVSCTATPRMSIDLAVFIALSQS